MQELARSPDNGTAAPPATRGSRRTVRVGLLLLHGLALAAPALAGDDGFAGSWSTSFGPLELRQEGARVDGTYLIDGAGGELAGQVAEGRLTFRYLGPGTNGDGWFELRDDGARLEGTWSPDGAPEWFPWNGRRKTTLERLPVLRPDAPVEGLLEASDPVVTTNALLQLPSEALARGKPYRFETSEPGPWSVELRAVSFDAYLVLRDVDGNVLAEDDDGLHGTDARIALPSLPAGRYLVEACALQGGLGPFELSTEAGSSPPPTLSELQSAEVAQAEKYLQRAEARFGPVHPETAAALSALAFVVATQGRLAEGQRMYERALSIREEILGPDHPATAESLDALAGVLGMQGLFDRARLLAERGLSIREETLGPDDLMTAASQSNLAGILAEEGLFDEARVLWERCLATAEGTLGPEHHYTALTLTSLGAVFEAQGLLEEARTCSERALHIWEALLGPDHVETARGQHNLALVLEAQGLFEEARQLLEPCLATCERELGPEHPYTAMSAAGLGRVLARLGQLEAARSLHERALAIREKTLGSAHPATAASLNELAGFLAGVGELESAFDCSSRAIVATEARVERTLPSLTESERLRYASELRATLELYLSLSLLVDREGMENASYERLLGWKGRVSRSLLSATSAPSGEEARLVAELRTVQRRLADGLYGVEVADGAARDAALLGLRERRNALELELVRARRPGAHDGADGAEIDVAAISNALPEDAVVVDFYVHRAFRPADPEAETPARWSVPRLTAWVLRQGAPTAARIDLGEAGPIEEATARFLRESVLERGLGVGEGTSAGASPAADALRRLLWQPLEEAIGEAELVFVSPDAFLGTLPFEILQREDGSYLVEHHGFVYLASVASLPPIEPAGETPDAEPRLLLVGGIDYRGRDALPAGAAPPLAGAPAPVDSRGSYRSTWRPLSSTRDEVDAIADIHVEARGPAAPRTVLTKRAATEERVKLELAGCRYVHLATHGYFQPEGLPSMWKGVQEAGSGGGDRGMRATERRITGLLPGLLSGLVFAGANAPPEPGRDNGLLTAEEVSTLDLARCELVVLSACETGLGRAESGEGMLGLRRAFRQAGARAVVSSLWSVKDEATSELMTLFYENLWLRGHGKLEALRRAQLDLLQRNRVEYGHGLPSTWGAFVLDGDWR